MRLTLLVAALLGLLGVAALFPTHAEAPVATSEPSRPGAEPEVPRAPPALLGLERTAAPRAQAVNTEAIDDPWTTGAAPAEPSKPPLAPEPTGSERGARGSRSLSRWRVGADGTLDEGFERRRHTRGPMDVELWTPPSSAEKGSLRAYDLAVSSAAQADCAAPLRGHGLPGGALPPRDPWSRRLLERVRDAVGAERWPDDSTLLAFTRPHGAPLDSLRLVVLQDDAGHREVEGVLSALARAQVGAVPVIVTVPAARRGARARQARLDVPWAAVRAHVGTSWAYVADVDIEVGNDWGMSALLCACDDGLGVSARRVEGRGGESEIELAIESASALRFGAWECPLLEFREVRLEQPIADRAEWRGRLPTRPRTHGLRMSDGTRVVITVGAEFHAGEECARVPVEVLDLDVAAWPEPAESTASVLVTWEPAPGAVRASAEIALPAPEGRAGAYLAEGAEPPVIEPRIDRRYVEDDSGCETGVHVTLLRRPLASGADLLDVEIRVGRRAEELRATTAPHRPYGGDETLVGIDVPSCAVWQTARRVALPAEGAVTLALEVDLGDGPQVGTLTLERR